MTDLLAPHCSNHEDYKGKCPGCVERLRCGWHDLQRQLQQAQDAAEEYENRWITAGQGRDAAIERAERAEERLSRHECICGGPSMQPCGSKCKYPLADAPAEAQARQKEER